MGLAKTAIFCLLGLFLMGCKNEEIIDGSYSAVARPDTPVAFFAVVNGIKPFPGIETAVQGIGTAGPVGGSSVVSFFAPVKYGDEGRFEWTITWLETNTNQGWEVSLIIKKKDFPEYSLPSDDPFARAFEKRAGEPLLRGYDFLFRFEEGGSLTVWTQSAELGSGQTDGLADWDDYVMLGQFCGKPYRDLANRAAFLDAKVRVEEHIEVSSPIHYGDPVPEVANCKN